MYMYMYVYKLTMYTCTCTCPWNICSKGYCTWSVSTALVQHKQTFIGKDFPINASLVSFTYRDILQGYCDIPHTAEPSQKANKRLKRYLEYDLM